MIDVETSIEPRVHVLIVETDGTRRTGSTTIADLDADQLADALIACVRGVAAMRGAGLFAAVERRLRLR